MFELIRQTFETLWAHKLRSFLTMFGIAWGVMSMVLLTASGEGFREGQYRASRGLGKDIMIMWGGRTSVQSRGYQAGREIRLKFSDFETIRDKAEKIAMVSPEISRRDLVSVTSWSNGTFDISGIYPDYQYMRSIDLEAGRPLNEADNYDRRAVCILGPEVAEQLFPRQNPLGQEMRINGLPFRVVGLIQKKIQNGSYGGRDVRKILIPFHTLVKSFSNPSLGQSTVWLNNIVCMPKDPEHFKEAERNVREALGEARQFDPLDEDALPIWNTAMGTRLVGRIINSMKWFLGAVGLVTLVLGGIGVMNIMLVTVRERTVEIGIRKSVGATRRHIMVQFFSESSAIAVLSGFIGLGAAYGIAALVNLLEAPPEVFAGMIITRGMAAFAFSSIGLVALLSGFVPATLAAEMDPISALRFEAG